jgi:hypothetical protein
MKRRSLLTLLAAFAAIVLSLGTGAATSGAEAHVLHDHASHDLVLDAPTPLQASCGNYRCEPPEDCRSCPSDCGDCCGNRRCEPPEDCRSCPSDCGDCCGNHRCEPPEDCRSCPSDCGRC